MGSESLYSLPSLATILSAFCGRIISALRATIIFPHFHLFNCYFLLQILPAFTSEHGSQLTVFPTELCCLFSIPASSSFVTCVVEINILDILSLCGCPTKLLIQHGSYVCAMAVTVDTYSELLSLCVNINLLEHNKLLCSVLFIINSLLQSSVPQTLVHKFGVAAVRGVVRNKNITEFQLEPRKPGQQVVNGILVQIAAHKRTKFKVGQGTFNDWPSIVLCPVGEWCIVSLLMQCLCCVCQVLSQLYQRSSTSFPSWLCWVGWG